ncbi:MAG: hypothetical protein ACLFUU_05935 [Desulfobacteraceae bacterium]
MLTPLPGTRINQARPGNQDQLSPVPNLLTPEFINQEVVKYIDYYRGHGFKDEDELLAFIELCWEPVIPGLRIPRNPVCPDHTPPAQFIVDAFFNRYPNCVVWANRSGGKTFDGALLTWLDAVFKPGCETKILGGSGEQSQRMYEHILNLATDEFNHLIEGELLKTRGRLTNKSTIQILTASSRSVRGPHPQKLKLDEVDEFDNKIFEAALLTPKTAGNIKASTHIYSTMHKPYGLMRRVITEAAERGYRIYKWCVFDVMEKCVGRDCQTCELWEDCGGKAKKADGYFPIEDAISLKRQVSEETWQSEMLCQLPNQEGLIYREFDVALHVI